MKKGRALIEKSDGGIWSFFSNAILSLGRFSNNHFNRTCINSSYQTGKLNVHRICTDPWFSDKNFNFQTSWKGECPDRIHAPQWGLCGDRQVSFWPNLAWSLSCSYWLYLSGTLSPKLCSLAVRIQKLQTCFKSARNTSLERSFWSQLLITIIRL